MIKKIFAKTLALSDKLKDIPQGKNKHFSFIVDKNKIVAIGWNDGWTTHTFCHKMGYRFSAIHSEVAAILKFKGKKKELRNYSLINVRINRFGQIGMAKPCHICQGLIRDMNFKKVWYTDQDGQFQRIK